MIRFLLEGTRSNRTCLGRVGLGRARGRDRIGAGFAGRTYVRATTWSPGNLRLGIGLRGVGCLAPLISLRLGSMLVSWLVAGAGAQILKITVDTMLQRSSPDDLRGRVFIAYDLVFNLSFVLGVTLIAALSLSVLDGALLPGALAVGYAVAALATRASSPDHWAS